MKCIQLLILIAPFFVGPMAIRLANLENMQHNLFSALSMIIWYSAIFFNLYVPKAQEETIAKTIDLVT